MIINMQSAGGSGSSPTLQTKSKTYTPTTSQQTEHITADAGFDGLAAVDVEVEAISPTKAAATYYPSSSDQSVASGQWLTGAQTFKGVVLTNLLASNIKNGVTVQVGDAQKLNRIAEITGTYSGGASNFVTGTFTTESTAGAYTLSIPYTGNGYPLALLVCVEGGAYKTGTAWYNSTQRYAIGLYAMTKADFSTAPTYLNTGKENRGCVWVVFKNSTSSSTSYSRSSSMTVNAYGNTNASNSATTTFRFKASRNTLSYYVNTSSYGLLPSTTYRYYIVYSE